MRKLMLDPEDLRVESFETHAPSGARGTVRGWQLAEPGDPALLSRGDCCLSPLCVDTPLASCDGTCSCTVPKDPQPVEPIGA